MKEQPGSSWPFRLFAFLTFVFLAMALWSLGGCGDWLAVRR